MFCWDEATLASPTSFLVHLPCPLPLYTPSKCPLLVRPPIPLHGTRNPQATSSFLLYDHNGATMTFLPQDPLLIWDRTVSVTPLILTQICSWPQDGDSEKCFPNTAPPSSNPCMLSVDSARFCAGWCISMRIPKRKETGPQL